MSHYLHIDIQDADQSTVGNVANTLDGGSIEVARKLGVLNKVTVGNALQEFFSGQEVVFDAISLTGAGSTGGV